MTATYTFDLVSTLDGYGSYTSDGDWGGFWGKAGPEFLEHRVAVYAEEQRMVIGANTYREFVQILGANTEPSEFDPVNDQMVSLPTTVVSRTLEGPLEWPPHVTLENGDGVEVVARLKEESDVPLRSAGSLSLNWALMAAGLVDLVQVAIFPVVSGRTGDRPIFGGAADFDLELIESRTFDGHTLELIYRPTLH